MRKTHLTLYNPADDPNTGKLGDRAGPKEGQLPT